MNPKSNEFLFPEETVCCQQQVERSLHPQLFTGGDAYAQHSLAAPALIQLHIPDFSTSPLFRDYIGDKHRI